jgi:hypothetical protein
MKLIGPGGFGCVDTFQPIDRAIQLERIAISYNNFGRQAWPGDRQQQRRNESAHVSFPYHRKTRKITMFAARSSGCAAKWRSSAASGSSS